MGCCNLRTLSFVVAGLSAFSYIIGIIYDIISMTEEYKYAKHEYDPHADFVLLLIYIAGFGTSLLFARGLQQKSLGLMAPFVYLSTGWIIYSTTSFIAFYNTLLVHSREYIPTIVLFFSVFLILCLSILFISPIFLIYYRMRALHITKKQCPIITDLEIRSSHP